jgi:hypothetical protein
MRLLGADALDAVACVASVNNAAMPRPRLARGYDTLAYRCGCVLAVMRAVGRAASGDQDDLRNARHRMSSVLLTLQVQGCDCGLPSIDSLLHPSGAPRPIPAYVVAVRMTSRTTPMPIQLRLEVGDALQSPADLAWIGTGPLLRQRVEALSGQRFAPLDLRDFGRAQRGHGNLLAGVDSRGSRCCRCVRARAGVREPRMWTRWTP